MAQRLALTPQDIHCVRVAYKTISSDFSKQFTVQAITSAVGINKNKLQSGFKSLYNKTVHECLLDIKIQRAENLLLNTDKPVKEIVYLAGFKDRSSLIKAFKKKHGIPPIAWKDQHFGANGSYIYNDHLLNAV